MDDSDPLSFLLAPAPPGPRTRAVILGELLGARTVINNMIPEYSAGRGNTPPAEYKAQSWLVHGLKAELRAFDCATRTPLELLQDDVETAAQDLADAMAAKVDPIESGVARPVLGWRLTAGKRLARAQAALAAFVPKRVSIKATPPQTPAPAALAAPLRSPAAQARLDAHIEADRVARLLSK